MEEIKVLDNQIDLDTFEMVMTKYQSEELKLRYAELKIELESRSKFIERFETILPNLCAEAGIKDKDKIPAKYVFQALDETYDEPEMLIQPSHSLKKYSLVKDRKVKNIDLHPTDSCALSTVLKKSAVRAGEIIREYTSENTRRAFNQDIIYWQAWLSAIGFSFNEPITEDVVQLFIIQHLEGMYREVDNKLVDQGYKYKFGTHALETVRRRLASLSIILQLDKHPNPCRNKGVRMLLNRLSKIYGSKSKKVAITKDVLLDLLDTCSGSSSINVRDKAILTFGFASGGRRRTEITNLNIEDLQISNKGIVATIIRSKTDQEGKGFEVPVRGVACRSLRNWMRLLNGVKTGPLFRSIRKDGVINDKGLSGIDINRIVKRRAKMSGYHNWNQYGAHSLRSGFITESGRQGKPLGDVMAMTNHKNVSTAMCYYQSGAVINNSASNLLD